MAKKKGANATQKAHYTTYKDQQKWRANRIKRLQQHLTRCPADKTARALLENPDKIEYRRNTNLRNVAKNPLKAKQKFLATLYNEVKQIEIKLPTSFRDKMKEALKA